MIKKSLIRITCIIFSLIVATSGALYLSTNTAVSENNNEFEVNQALTEENNLVTYDKDITRQNQKTSSYYKNSNGTLYNKNNTKTNNFDDINEGIINKHDAESNYELVTSSAKSADISTLTTSISTNSNNTQSQASSSCTTSDYLPPSSQEVSSNRTTSDIESNQTTSGIENNKITTELVNSIALSLSKTYNIKILIARQTQDYNDLLITNYANNNEAINSTLLSLSRFLSILPKGFIEYFNINHFVLVGELKGNASVSLTTNNNSTDLLFDCSKVILPSDTIKLIANMMAKIAEKTFDINEFNPDNFIYGVTKSEYVYSSKNQIACYFLNNTCQQSQTQDLSETITFIILNPNKLIVIPETSSIIPKIKALCFDLKSNYPLLGDNRAISFFTNQ